MADQDDTERRIRAKAHALWEAEGRPHGRAEAHWTAAREMVAIEDSYRDTLKPPPPDDAEPTEPSLAIENQAEQRQLTAQGDEVDAPSYDVAAENADARPDSPPGRGRGGPGQRGAPGRQDTERVKADADGQFAPSQAIRDNDGLAAAKPVAFTGDGDATRPLRTERRR